MEASLRLWSILCSKVGKKGEELSLYQFICEVNIGYVKVFLGYS